MRSMVGIKVFLVIAACFSLCSPVFGLPPNLNVEQLYHTQWTPREGAPSDIESLAQTNDGYLWMGTPTGLFRFDGVRFERVESVGGQQLHSASIYSLWAPPEGGLWVGHRYGGATFISDGRLTNYAEAEGLPLTSLLNIARDGVGTVWAGTMRGLFRLSGDGWIAAEREWNVPEGIVSLIRLDGAGTLWTVVGETVLFLKKGASQFQDTGIRLPIASYDAMLGAVTAPDGVVWLFYANGKNDLVLHAPGGGRKITVHVEATGKSAGYGSYNIIDRDGHFWFLSVNGIRRIRLDDGARRELHWKESQLGKVVGLTAGTGFGIVEDLEGNIWVGTSGGLNRFRAPALAKVDLPGGWWFPIARGEGDGILAGALGTELFKLSADSMPERVTAPSVSDPNIPFSVFYRDPQGDLWTGSAGSNAALWNRRGGRWHSLQRPLKVRIAPSDSVVQTMAMDSAGAMWVSIVQEGVYRVVGDTWIPFGGLADLPRQAADIIVADDQKRIWFGYLDGRVVLLDNERLTTFASEQGLEVGVVLAIAAREGSIWVGGEGGLAWFDGRRFLSVRRAGGKALPGISGIVEMPDGDLWLGTAEGAMHIESAEISKMRKDAGHRVTPTVLSHLDGMPGMPHGVRPLPTAISSRDGRVWFTTHSGVVWTDSKLRTRNAVVPSVFVNSIDADGAHHTSWSRGPLRLQPRTQNLQISYTALSLTMPERVHFKYRLEGHDSAWQDAGTRREAFYTDLEPGHYVFRVIASNNDGVWNEKGATVEFIIPPTFVQTVWFTALWVVVALGLMLLMFAWWLRQAQAQLRARLNERLVERERIARDLHDTFLQAVQGLMLRFQTAAERIPPQEPARKFMEDALDRADRVLADGRQKIMTLRSAEAPDTDLSQDLRIAGEELARDSGVAFDLTVAGTPRVLHPIVREEAYRIGVEALANAFRHARASRVVARIDYGRRGLVMKITDDGCGFDTSVDRESDGHWGLRGMRERAARIRAKLEINSRIGKGTSLELAAPAEIA